MSFMNRITDFFANDRLSKVGIDLSRPSLEAVAYLLRHPTEWPKAFRWDYTKFEHCALGLAIMMWPSLGDLTSLPDDIGDDAYSNHYAAMAARGFRISIEDAEDIFTYAHENDIFSIGLKDPCLEPEDVTPEHVAMVIDVYRKKTAKTDDAINLSKILSFKQMEDAD